MGFTQSQINEHKQMFHQHGKHGFAKVTKDTQSSPPVTIKEAKQLQRLRPMAQLPNRPRTAENASANVFANAGLASLERNVAPSRQLVLVRVRKKHCKGCGRTTLLVQPVASYNIKPLPHRVYESSASPSSVQYGAGHYRQLGASASVRSRPSHHNITATGHASLPLSVYPYYTSAASAVSASSTLSDSQPARSMLGNWVTQARRQINTRASTRKRLGLNWFRFDEKAAAAADGDLEEAEALSRECCICLEEVAHGDKVSVLPCGHRFHYSCILDWVQNTPFCPLCKASAVDVNAKPRAPQHSHRAKFKKHNSM